MARMKLNQKQMALTFGSLAAIVHVVWVLFVVTGNAQGWLNFVLGLHFITSSVVVGGFVPMVALTLIVVTFVLGYVIGWLFATLWNWWGSQKYWRI